jgi:hypothetical protein
MKKVVLSVFTVLSGLIAMAQEENKEIDTTRMKIGKSEVIIVTPRGEEKASTSSIEDSLAELTGMEDEDEFEGPEIEPHWAGLSFGPTALLNASNKQSFPGAPQWQNDPAKSFSWEFNFIEKKFPIYQNYVGITTGLGVNWTQIGLGQRKLIVSDTSISSILIPDSVSDFRKNKLRATYITAPLLLEFCSKNSEDSWYFAAGVIGGIRVNSLVKTVIENGDDKQKRKEKGTYGLETFRVDATARLGYGNWGVYANYGLTNLFSTKKTAEVHPFSVGLTLNF